MRGSTAVNTEKISLLQRGRAKKHKQSDHLKNDGDIIRQMMSSPTIGQNVIFLYLIFCT